jgi:HPt (histidine-containing phosphotransfer) domain-containing protein
VLENKDWNLMKFQVHKLKPNFAMVGLTWISAKMQELENIFRSNPQPNEEEVVQLFKDVRSEVDKFYPLIEEQYARMQDFIATQDENQ